MQKDFDSIVLRWMYRRLYQTFGKRHWWPADTPFEVIVGTILTQGTHWSNVEKSIRILRRKKYLTPKSLHRLDTSTLAKAIRSSGFFNVKAKRLKNFLFHLYQHWNGDLDRMFKVSTSSLRKKLLAISGLGKETVDSILLYAGGRPTFVVDTYTRRILSRHGLLSQNEAYDQIQNYFLKSLPHQSPLFNEYHALLVEVGKRYCRNTPLCKNCPLGPLPRTKIGCVSFVEGIGEKRS